MKERALMAGVACVYGYGGLVVVASLYYSHLSQGQPVIMSRVYITAAAAAVIALWGTLTFIREARKGIWK